MLKSILPSVFEYLQLSDPKTANEGPTKLRTRQNEGCRSRRRVCTCRSLQAAPQRNRQVLRDGAQAGQAADLANYVRLLLGDCLRVGLRPLRLYWISRFACAMTETSRPLAI